MLSGRLLILALHAKHLHTKLLDKPQTQLKRLTWTRSLVKYLKFLRQPSKRKVSTWSREAKMLNGRDLRPPAKPKPMNNI